MTLKAVLYILCHGIFLKLFKKTNYFFFPGQIPLQYASIEKDVAACEKVKRSVLPSASAEFKPSSREQVKVFSSLSLVTW